MADEKRYFVYMLRCEDNSLYTGYTTDLKRRFSEHCGRCGSKGAKYTRLRGVIGIAAAWSANSLSSALRLEALIKHLKKSDKERLVRDNIPLSEIFGEKLCAENYTVADCKDVDGLDR